MTYLVSSGEPELGPASQTIIGIGDEKPCLTGNKGRGHMQLLVQRNLDKETHAGAVLVYNNSAAAV